MNDTPQFPDYRTAPKVRYKGRDWTSRILASLTVAIVFGTAGFCGGKESVKAPKAVCQDSVRTMSGSGCEGGPHVTCDADQKLTHHKDDYTNVYWCECIHPEASNSVSDLKPLSP